jgi:uridylate kinase
MNVLIKFSGEFFTPYDSLIPVGLEVLNEITQLSSAYMVVGGGNRIRGRSSNLPRNAADHLGIISSMMNSFVLNAELQNRKLKSQVFTHFASFGAMYDPDIAKSTFENGSFVIFGSGLGRVGYCSTDLNSVVKSLEVGADVMIKITKVGGVFDKDPSVFNDAVLLPNPTYDQLITQNLNVCDIAAIGLAKEHNLPIVILSAEEFPLYLKGKKVGSQIR